MQAIKKKMNASSHVRPASSRPDAVRQNRQLCGSVGPSLLFQNLCVHPRRGRSLGRPPDGSTSPPVTPSAPLCGCPVCAFDASRRATSIRPQTNPPSRRVPSKMSPTRLRHRSDPAELAKAQSALRGCRARPTRSYALSKAIASSRHPDSREPPASSPSTRHRPSL